MTIMIVMTLEGAQSTLCDMKCFQNTSSNGNGAMRQ